MASDKSALGFPIVRYVLMHRSLVERRLVAESRNWPWSSWRRYRLAGASLLTLDLVS